MVSVSPSGRFCRKDINYKMLELYPGRLLVNALIKKMYRKNVRNLGRSLGFKSKPESGYERAVSYNGVVVFDSPDLDGEGTTIGQDYIRALLELGFKRCERIFEFCAGPGYIGYSLLANGFCEKLTLADINPAAVEMEKKTASYNKIEHLVNIYQSNIFDSIPSSEKWDLVVSNPPHFPLSHIMGNTPPGEVNIKAHDPDWKIHRRFYLNVKKFIKPGGHVVMQENTLGGQTAELFKPMIEEGGGKFVLWKQSVDVCGQDNPMFYIVSQW